MSVEIKSLENKINMLEAENKLLHDKINSIEDILKKSEKLPKECFSNMAQYVVPKIRNNNYEMLLSDYKYNGITERLITALDNLSNSKFCWLAENNKLWLLYMQVLLESDNTNKAENILNRYFYFHKLKDVEFFPTVAHLFYSLGLRNEQTERASVVYKALKDAEEKQVFEKLVRGKSIAVVGNGPYELGKGKGDEIDAHDVVVRFSNGISSGYAKDYGAKTTIWVNTSSNFKLKDYEGVDFELSMWRFDTFYFRDESGLENIYSLCDRPCQIFGAQTAQYAWNELQLNYIITTGCDFILHLYNTLGSFDNVNFYGFHFLSSFKNEDNLYFFSEATYIPSSYHDLDNEPQFMKKIILERGGKLNEK